MSKSSALVDGLEGSIGALKGMNAYSGSIFNGEMEDISHITKIGNLSVIVTRSNVYLLFTDWAVSNAGRVGIIHRSKYRYFIIVHTGLANIMRWLDIPFGWFKTIYERTSSNFVKLISVEGRSFILKLDNLCFKAATFAYKRLTLLQAREAFFLRLNQHSLHLNNLYVKSLMEIGKFYKVSSFDSSLNAGGNQFNCVNCGHDKPQEKFKSDTNSHDIKKQGGEI